VIVTRAVLLSRLVQRDRLFMDSARGEAFARQWLDERAAVCRRNRGRRGVSVGMAVVVVFEVFENIAHV
jgi:hypothetical protein